jgi:hypothetical protein
MMMVVAMGDMASIMHPDNSVHSAIINGNTIGFHPYRSSPVECRGG